MVNKMVVQLVDYSEILMAEMLVMMWALIEDVQKESMMVERKDIWLVAMLVAMLVEKKDIVMEDLMVVLWAFLMVV